MGEGLFDQGKAVEQGEDLPTDHPLAETKGKEWGKEEVCFVSPPLTKAQGIWER